MVAIVALLHPGKAGRSLRRDQTRLFDLYNLASTSELMHSAGEHLLLLAAIIASDRAPGPVAVMGTDVTTSCYADVDIRR